MTDCRDVVDDCDEGDVEVLCCGFVVVLKGVAGDE